MRHLTILVLLLLIAPTAAAGAVLKASGSLDVAATSRVWVLATDPTVQDVLRGDFAVARRPAAKGSEAVTLTVTLSERKLTPEITLDAVAPGVPDAAALILAAGYQSPSEQQPKAEQTPVSREVEEYMNQGRPPSQAVMPTIQDLYRLNHPRGMGSGMGLPRFANKQPYSSPLGDGEYDTAVVAHAVLSDGKGDLTVVAVAHPGEDLEAVKKQVAERIANAVLH